MNSFSAVDCGPLSAPKNGSFVGDSTVFPNSLLFACNLGFILDGSYRRTCQANGTWDGLETVCIGKFTVEINISESCLGLCNLYSFLLGSLYGSQ